MKKVLLTCAALLLVFGFVGTANAQVCINFDGFCDALELNAAGGVIDGTWVSWDCLGSNSPVEGTIGGGQAIVQCTDAACPNGSSYAFVIVGGTFDLYLTDNGNPIQLQDDAAWTLSQGSCPTFPINSGVGTLGNFNG